MAGPRRHRDKRPLPWARRDGRQREVLSPWTPQARAAAIVRACTGAGVLYDDRASKGDRMTDKELRDSLLAMQHGLEQAMEGILQQHGAELEHLATGREGGIETLKAEVGEEM